MARKLSDIARCASFFVIASAATISAKTALAQDEIQSSVPSNIITNPFAASQPQPRVVAEEPQAPHRPAITYQNPFAAMSKSPPMEASLRPGPISRWRRPNIAGHDSSPIKSAVLALQPVDLTRPSWDQFGPDTIQFTPKPLTQPAWLSDSDAPVSNDIRSFPFDPALFDWPLNTGELAKQNLASPAGMGTGILAHAAGAIDIDSARTRPAKSNVSPPILSDSADTPQSWYEQAQHAASISNTSDDLTAVIEICDRGMRSGPDKKLSSSLRRLSAWAHNRRGEFQAEAGRADDALDDFQKAIALDANCSLAIHNRAVTLAQQNQFAAALRDFNRVIELNPGLAVAYRNRAELLAALGRMDEAIADYNQAIESLPNNAQLFRGRAYGYQRLGRFHEALADINRALDLSPNDAEILTQRGNLAAEQGDYDRAIADFRKALAIDPNWVDAYRSEAWFLATCPNPKFHNPQQAIAAAEHAAKLSPGNDYLLLDTLAAARASAGQFPQAIETQEKALACAPPELATSFEQRLALYRQGRAYRSAPASKDVRTVSNESPVDSAKSESTVPVSAGN